MTMHSKKAIQKFNGIDRFHRQWISRGVGFFLLAGWKIISQDPICHCQMLRIKEMT
jgi:hypothetical protein